MNKNVVVSREESKEIQAHADAAIADRHEMFQQLQEAQVENERLRGVLVSLVERHSTDECGCPANELENGKCVAHEMAKRALSVASNTEILDTIKREARQGQENLLRSKMSCGHIYAEMIPCDRENAGECSVCCLLQGERQGNRNSRRPAKSSRKTTATVKVESAENFVKRRCGKSWCYKNRVCGECRAEVNRVKLRDAAIRRT